MIAPANASPNDEPERPAGRVHARRLADALLLDRRERVVVQLRDEQPEAAAGDQERHDHRTSRSARAGRSGSAPRRRPRAAANPARMILLGLRLPGPLAGEQRDREHAQRERRERQPCLERVVLEHHLEVDRERDHQPAERDLLQRLGRDPEPEVLRREEAGVEQRRLALALAPPEPPRRASRARPAPTAISAPTAPPPSCQTRIPSTTPPMPTAERTAPTTSIAASRCTARRGRACCRAGRSR